MKCCKDCGKEYEEDSFPIARVINDKVYRRRLCSACYSLTKKPRKEMLKVWLREYKKNLSCLRCGFSDYRALEFHHKEDNKEHTVSNMVSKGFSPEKILVEIKKCECLCSNCHRIEHYPG